jgi:hypothetical protein
VSIPDAILLKPDRLTDAEFAIMKQHTVYGRDAIVNVEMRWATPTPSCAMRARSPTRTRKNTTAPVIRKGWRAMPSRCRRG